LSHLQGKTDILIIYNAVVLTTLKLNETSEGIPILNTDFFFGGSGV
jgi:hypothetical protein